METLLATTALTIAGLMTGNEFAVWLVHRTLRRVPDAAHAAVAAALAGVYGRIMPFWYAGTLLLTIAVAIVIPWGRGSWYVVGAAVVWGATILLAAIVLAPLNQRVAGWKTDALPQDWREQRTRWDRLHTLRVMLLVAGWILLIVGVVLSSAAGELGAPAP